MATKKKAGRGKAKAGKGRPARKPPRKAAARKTPRKAAAKAVRDRRKRDEPQSLRLRSASPGFTANDLQRSMAFYRDALGFTVKNRFERDGKLQGAELVAGTVSFYVSQDDWQKGRNRVKGEGFRIYCTTVQPVDELARQIKARGGTLAQEPTDQPWGSRDIALTDPDGFKVTIANEK